MRRRLAWVVLALLAVCAVYGILHERLFDQYIWYPVGVKRFVRAAAVYWAVAGLLIWLRRQWLAPVIAGFVLLYSTWWCGRFFEWWAPLAVIYFLGSSYFLGRWIAKKTDGITALLVGVAAWIFVISIVVRFPVNTRWIYVVAFLVPYAHARRLEIRWSWPRVTLKEAACFAVLAFVLLLHWLVVLKPEISSDGLAMHLAIPMAVAHEARWAFDFDRYTWALMPMGGDWAFTAAYLIGGEAAARLLNFAMLALISALIYRGSRRCLSAGPAMLAAALFVSTPLVQMVTGSLFVENVWAVMIVGAAFALWQGELVWAGLLFGAAMSTKVGTIAYLAPAAVVAATLRPRWRTVAAAVGLFLLFAAPPYVNSWARTGNPMFPFYNQIFKSRYFDTDPTSVQDVRFRKKLDWKSPYESTFRSTDYYEGQNGSLGFQYFLLLAPLLVLLRRGAPWTIVALGFGGLALTFLTVPNLRYLYPALALLTVAMAWMISEMPPLVGGVAAVIALNLWFLPASNYYHKEFALFRRVQMEEYLITNGPQRELIEYLNRTAPGEPVAFFAGSPIAGLHARAYSDQWRTYGFWKQMINSHSPEEVAALFQEKGIKHVIAPLPIDFEYLPVRRFLQSSTVPTGVKVGRFALLDVVPPRAVELEPPPVPGAGAYDDLDPRIEYAGAWAQGRAFKGAANRSASYSRIAGDSLRFAFEGSSIAYVYTRAANRGTAQVSVDGRVLATISLYSPGTKWQTKSVLSNLEPGRHTIEVQVLPQKNPKSTDYYVDLDELVVGK